MEEGGGDVSVVKSHMSPVEVMEEARDTVKIGGVVQRRHTHGAEEDLVVEKEKTGEEDSEEHWATEGGGDGGTGIWSELVIWWKMEGENVPISLRRRR